MPLKLDTIQGGFEAKCEAASVRKEWHFATEANQKRSADQDVTLPKHAI